MQSARVGIYVELMRIFMPQRALLALLALEHF
ncbi:hypothetical protein M233_03655 [Xylella fastidiosa subsp. multiplex Griffin-1]|nr:hypothetical protein M233_03655 [Xylella fastidiosa subsp. multiplex Griffin-1]